MTLNTKAMTFLAATARDIRQGEAHYNQCVPSPCMSVCQMDDDTGLCKGCLRTLDEIRQWSGFNEAGKRAVWEAIDARVAQFSA